MSININIGGAWKQVTDPQCNIGGVWKKISAGFCNIGGVWKELYKRAQTIWEGIAGTTPVQPYGLIGEIYGYNTHTDNYALDTWSGYQSRISTPEAGEYDISYNQTQGILYMFAVGGSAYDIGYTVKAIGKTSSPINLTGYSKLYVDCEAVKVGDFFDGMGMSPIRDGSSNISVINGTTTILNSKTVGIFGRTIKELDISSISGNYIIAVFAQGESAINVGIQFKVYKIWLE